MSAIFGVLDFDRSRAVGPLCASMADVLAVYGPHRCAIRERDGIAFGRRLYALLPEDQYDNQPLTGGPFLLVADIRLDNREELASALRLEATALRSHSDADILLKAWEHWEEGVFDRLVGDYAFALWDSRAAKLILARDPLGKRPLHYHRRQGYFAFCSMPQGLHALGIGHEPDETRVAGFMLGQPRGDGNGFFRGIERVRPGHWLTVSQEGTRSQRHWDPQPRELRLSGFSNYVEAFRANLDEATRCRLRGANGVVAAHLSSGQDSSAVATTAARLLASEGGAVVAFTAAPREGFDGPIPRGRIGDESALAALTAAQYDNMEHVVVRSTGKSPFDYFGQSFDLFQEPASNVCNHVWWAAINDRIGERGIRVALNGTLGNISISAGSLLVLADLVRRGRWAHWWRESRDLTKAGTVRWRAILGNSFGACLPRSAWHMLCRLFLDYPREEAAVDLVRQQWLQAYRATNPEPALTNQPSWNSYAARLRTIQLTDPANFLKGTLAGWGVDERDPTSDRRIIEFCLSVPPDQLLRDGKTRALSRAGLADRVPAAVLDGAFRGCQGADWYESLSQERLRRELRALETSSCAASVVDLERLRCLVQSWPPGDWARSSILTEYRRRMLLAFSAGDFLRRAAAQA